MANDFKRFAVTNVNTSSGASASSVYSVPAGAGSSALESIVIGITISISEYSMFYYAVLPVKEQF